MQTKNSISTLAYELRFIQVGTKISYKNIMELREYVILAEQLENKSMILSGDFEVLENFINYVDRNIVGD